MRKNCLQIVIRQNWHVLLLIQNIVFVLDMIFLRHLITVRSTAPKIWLFIYKSSYKFMVMVKVSEILMNYVQDSKFYINQSISKHLLLIVTHI